MARPATGLPAYAQKMLHPAQFERYAVLHWGASSGPIVAAKDASSTGYYDPVFWDGTVRCGGFVERLHTLVIDEMAFTVAEIVGGARLASDGGLASLDEMRRGLFSKPIETEPIGSGMAYPFVMEPDDPFAGLLQDALVSGLAVDAVGTIAPADSGYEIVVGLPLVMRALTLLR